MSGFGGGGGGGQGPAGPPGQGVPTGGTVGQSLRKASNANYDTEWSSATVPSFTYQELVSVTGTEVVGDRIVITIPAAVLPAVPFNWAVEGNGYGTFFFTNIGAAGTVSGQFYCDVWDGTAWLQAATAPVASAFPSADPTIARGSPGGAGSTRLYRYDPAVLNEIRFSLRVYTAASGIFTWNVGLQGYIIL
jgi:hypothetical protein